MRDLLIQIPIIAFLLTLAFMLLYIPFSKYEKAVEENRWLKDKLEPKLRIIFKRQRSPFVARYDDGKITQYRVAVVSPTSVRDVELIANEVEIGEGFLESGLHLRERHDRKEAKRVALKPFKAGMWDIVSTHLDPHSGNVIAVLNHITKINQVVFPVGTYEFEIMASGGDHPPTTAVVEIEVRTKSVGFNVRDGRLSDLLN